MCYQPFGLPDDKQLSSSSSLQPKACYAAKTERIVLTHHVFVVIVTVKPQQRRFGNELYHRVLPA